MSNNDWFERGELPPVGFHCECTYQAKRAWRECLILPRGKIYIFSDGWEKVDLITDDFEFRPIKSEREKAIDEMLAIDCHPQDGMLSRHDFCAALYDAGYRKVEV